MFTQCSLLTFLFITVLSTHRERSGRHGVRNCSISSVKEHIRVLSNDFVYVDVYQKCKTNIKNDRSRWMVFFTRQQAKRFKMSKRTNSALLNISTFTYQAFALLFFSFFSDCSDGAPLLNEMSPLKYISIHSICDGEAKRVGPCFLKKPLMEAHGSWVFHIFTLCRFLQLDSHPDFKYICV